MAAGCPSEQAGCGPPAACVFTKALLARTAVCELSRRHAAGERELISCGSPVAHANCRTLAALLRERATFALRLPPPAAPLMHAKALQLQCAGLLALADALQCSEGVAPDAHRLVGLAHERWGSLLDAPWGEIVPVVAAWQPRRRHRPPA